MADYNSRLPIRTEANGDAVIRLVDGTITSQFLTINADGSINITDNGGSITVDAVDLDIRNLTHVSDSVKIGDGTDLLAVNADGSINSVVTATDLDIRNLVFATDKVDVSGSAVTVSATDLDIRDLNPTQDEVKARILDEAGNAFSEANPLPVTMVESEGAEVNNFDDAAAVAGNASSDHDYTVTAGKTLMLTQFAWCSAGRAKFELKVETGVASGTFDTKFVTMTSTAEPSGAQILKEAISVAAGVRVRITKTNRESSATDLYSTICGHEI